MQFDKKLYGASAALSLCGIALTSALYMVSFWCKNYFSHFWFATVQEVLQADWQDA